jgi:hypothetical protein
VQLDRGAEKDGGSAVRDALARILRPIARLMIHRGVPLGEVVALLKAALVDVAEREAALPGKRLTDSRISLVTGVHRKDVSALRQNRRPESKPHANLAATVVGRWMGDPDLQQEGAPARLYRSAADGAPSFEALVSTISSDVRPRTVLDELEMLGAVAPDPVDPRRLVLLVDAVAPSGEAAAALAFFAANLGDHAEAATRNLAAREGGLRFLERAVFYNRMPSDGLDAIEARCRRDALALLSALNADALAAQDSTKGEARERFRFGVYFYREVDENGSRREGQ